MPSPWVRMPETGVGSAVRQGQRREQKCVLSAAVEWRQTTSHPRVWQCLWMFALALFFLIFGYLRWNILFL